jgi:acetyl esterase/lipase
MKKQTSKIAMVLKSGRMIGCLLGTILMSSSLVARTASAIEPMRISLWNGKAPAGEGSLVDGDAFITVYRPAKASGAAMVICPGGGYGGLVLDGEGSGIAKWLNKHEITGIVLEYRLPHGNRFVPLLDAQRAIRLTRANAVKWGCDPKKVGIIGFSAGGHLASTAATHFDSGNAADVDPVNRLSSRPDFAILIYPVITMGGKTHGGSKQNLLGSAPSAATVALYSNELQVTSQTPPTFLAHAMDDTVVSPDNSQMFYEAMKAHKVPGKYLELPDGGHGLNGYRGSSWDAWQTQSLQWLSEMHMITIDQAKNELPNP